MLSIYLYLGILFVLATHVLQLLSNLCIRHKDAPTCTFPVASALDDLGQFVLPTQGTTCSFHGKP